MPNYIVYEGEKIVNVLRSVSENSDILVGLTVLKDPDISLLDTVEKKYIKVSGGVLVEMTQAEKDAVDQTILDASNSAKTSSVNDLDITIKDAFIAWLTVYNSKVPPQYRVTGAELKQQLLTDMGL